MTIMQNDDLMCWVEKFLDAKIDTVIPIPGDAGFRTYYRMSHGQDSFIAANAPPATENNAAFIAVAKAFSEASVRVPTIFNYDLDKGWFLLEDFGDQLFADHLTSETAETLYVRALPSLEHIQSVSLNDYGDFAQFDAAYMRRELDQFREWVIKRYLKLRWPRWADAAMDRLCMLTAAQPIVCIHRDYHAHNLMLLPDAMGVLDFQDALWGPITYDIVSLLCDRDYHIVPVSRDIQLKIASQFFDVSAVASQAWTQTTFERDFDNMAIQRRMKAAFIFARKWLRDQNPRYLSYLPHALGHARRVSAEYPEWSTLHRWLNETVLPRLYEVQSQSFRVNT